MTKRAKGKKGLAVLLAAAMAVRLMPGTGTWKASAASRGAATQAETAGADGTQAKSTANVWNGTSVDFFDKIGAGTAEDPYQISTGAQLAYLARKVNNTKYSSNKYAKAYYILTSDIDLNNKTWTGIGHLNCYFNGHFDGNGKTISNVTGSGLFDDVGGDVTIKNLTVENINLTSSTGGLVDQIDSGKGTSALIQNCHVSGRIESSNSFAKAGLVRSARSTLRIETCSSSVNITGTGYLVGIIGDFYSSADDTLTIRNCTNSGKMESTETSSGNVGAAGIVARLTGGKTLIENCVNTGEIVAQSGGQYYGGIVSESKSTKGNTIRNCENYGNITCKVEKSSILTAGICAYERYTEIYNCSNAGTIKNSENALYCGGIVAGRGFKDTPDTEKGAVYNCFNSGTIEPAYGGQIIGSEDTLYNVSDNYYVKGSLAANGANNANNYRISQEQAASGYLAFALNGMTEGNVWKQKIGTDAYPKINGSENIVYANGNCSAKVTEFSNKPLSPDADKDHDLILVAASDADCGHNGYKEHYECQSCHAFFENNTDNKAVRKSDFITREPTGKHLNYDENGLCAVCGNAYEKADKDEQGKYVIKNTGNFIWYANAINTYNYSAIPVEDSEIFLLGFDAKLESDIDLSLVYNETTGKSWEPIAYDTYRYVNELDGQGHTIKGLYINSVSLNYAGLVKKMSYETAYIHDIIFTDVNINAPRASYVGAVAGQMEVLKTASCIENCIVKSGTINGKKYVGGLVGYVAGNNADKFKQENKNILYNCANAATVTCESYAGGLIGYTEANGKNVNIANCYNVGTVSGTTTGDIVGKIAENTSVVNSYYSGSKAFGENTVSAVAMQKTSAQFGNGEVAYLLQDGQAADKDGNIPEVWGQTIGENGDIYPVLGGAKVYQNKTYTGCEGIKGQTPSTIEYSNTELPTVYADHTDDNKDNKCDHCGYIMDGIGARLAGYSLSLSGNIGVNFYMELSDDVAKNEDAYVNFTLPNGTTQKVYVSGSHADGTTATTDTTVKEGTTYYVFACEVAAKEMTSDIKAQIIAGDKEGTEYTYTVKEYADYILNHAANETNAGSYDAETVALVKAMLHYGGSTQKYFDYQTEKLASDGITVSGDISKDWMNQDAYKTVIDGAKDVCTFKAAYLSLKSTTDICVYVKLAEGVSADKTKFYIGDTQVTPQETTYKGEDCYMLTVSGVEAKNLASMFTFKVTTGEGEKSKAATLSYGAFSYASTVFESTHDDKVGIDKLRDVMNSMYLYYDRAVAYDTK